MPDTFAVESFGGRVRVACDDLALSEWLREVLAPGFAEVAPRADDIAVVIADREPATGSGPATLAPCFALDDQVVHLPGRRSGALVVDDEGAGAQYLVGHRSVRLWAVTGAASLRLPAFRIVRELLIADARTAPVVQLHTSAVAVESGVVVFAGPKGAGKTTVLAHVAASTGAPVVANDRVMLRRRPSGWQVRGVPTIVRVRPGTIEALPHLFASVAWVGDSPEGPMLNLPAFARAVGVPLAAGGPAIRLALLTRNDHTDAFAVRLLPPDEAARRLAPARFGALTEPRPPTVFEEALGYAAAPEDDPGLLGALAREVPCVELRVGPRLLASAGAGRDLLGALT
jgi:hypothetical protein